MEKIINQILDKAKEVFYNNNQTSINIDLELNDISFDILKMFAGCGYTVRQIVNDNVLNVTISWY